MIQIALFDVDGVLAIGEPWPVALARDYGITPKETGDFYHGPFAKCLRGQADAQAELPLYLAQWGWPGTLDDFMSAWCRHERTLDTTLLARMAALRASGVPCYLATVQERYRAAYLLDEMGLGALTDGMFVSCEIGAVKEEPAFWHAVLAAFPGVAPHEIHLFDDAQRNIEAARAAGLSAHLYVSLEDFDTALARHMGG